MRFGGISFAAFLCMAPAQAHASDCLKLVRKFITASDWSDKGVWDQVTWPDGLSVWTDGSSTKFSKIYFGGAGRKYRTFIRGIKTGIPSPSHQTVSTKEISQILQYSSYNGSYQVTRHQYVCQRRKGEWRVKARRTVSVTYGTNEAAAKEWRKTWADDR